MIERIVQATQAVVARLRRAGMDGPADLLEWTVGQRDVEALFLAAERCIEACGAAERLPAAVPRTMGRAFSAARDAGLALAVGMKDSEGLVRKVPTGFGMSFGMSGRSARVLVPEVLSAGLVFWCGREWGEGCRVRAWGAVPEVEPAGYSASLPLLSRPSSAAEEEVFQGLVERLLVVGVPWAFPMDGMTAPRVPCEMACRMLFHATGHAARGNDAQCAMFLAGTMREAAA